MTSSRPFDYVVCCTKNIPDVSPTVSDIIEPAISPGHTVIVLIQNGLNIEKPLFSRFPSNIVVSGISWIDAHEIAPGVIEQKQKDLLHIGAFENPLLSKEEQQAAAERFVSIYNAGGKTTCLYKPDVNFDRWSKLVYNASFNPICALTGLNTGELQRMGRAMDKLVLPAMEEVLAVARTAGQTLPTDIVEKTIQSNPISHNIVPSMQIDLQKVSLLLVLSRSIRSSNDFMSQGNFIEHENILGEIIEEARKGQTVATPVLCTLYELCNALQWRLKMNRSKIQTRK